MSKANRLDWSRQVTLMNERIKSFQANPGQEQLDAVIAELQAYAEAARSGGIEIPAQFTVN
ncbi:hypothetical protein ACFFKC_01405 [Pseudoduganella danionis]|uniref:Uncharacterized protein n=1 Tax=Pseudoduganella danionis TaxID=1890295 RepID=A0ABW9SN48_9BURK|nr:hypothetical protein [Pseudoduganella danionis]MTW31829.1 hypothetical protein [Pseudoduganella danionis]